MLALARRVARASRRFTVRRCSTSRACRPRTAAAARGRVAHEDTSSSRARDAARSARKTTVELAALGLGNTLRKTVTARSHAERGGFGRRSGCLAADVRSGSGRSRVRSARRRTGRLFGACSGTRCLRAARAAATRDPDVRLAGTDGALGGRSRPCFRAREPRAPRSRRRSPSTRRTGCSVSRACAKRSRAASASRTSATRWWRTGTAAADLRAAST